ncbi:hypothetical protein D3C80_1863870 [compost metagenome]
MAASQAASMSRALTTSMRLTRSGVGRCTGPLIRVTLAPASAAASARAKPILPELWLVM